MTDNYIPINDFAFAGHFMDKDIALAPEDLVAIKPLAKTYSVTLWKKYISEQHRHLMQIPSEQANFTVDDNTPQVSYTDYWNNSHFTPIATKLDRVLNWAPEAVIYHFWAQEQAVETNWRIFTRYWQNFVFEDEANIVINPESNNVILLSNGIISFGKQDRY